MSFKAGVLTSQGRTYLPIFLNRAWERPRRGQGEEIFRLGSFRRQYPYRDKMNSPTSPLVAVVTPVYNGADYLAKAMRSVQSQDYPNLIHVILNNASTDATAAIIDAFRGGRVELLSSNNEVVAPLRESWNKAFSLIPKEAIYVKLLCADDLMHPSHITRCVKLAEADSQIEIILSDDVYRDMVC